MSVVNWLDWPAPSHVKACFTDRVGGVSKAPFDSFNLGLHVGDDELTVNANRRALLDSIGKDNTIHWLEQVHSIHVVNVDEPFSKQADASYSKQVGQVCCVMTADCLPVFFSDHNGQQVAIAHAGWRGLCDGIIQKTVATFNKSSNLMAYLGPAISQSAFEVGEEVRALFVTTYPHLPMQRHFKQGLASNKWMADLYGIATEILTELGVQKIYGGGYCTFGESDTFFSYRRDQETGRMAHLIWLE